LRVSKTDTAAVAGRIGGTACDDDGKMGVNISESRLAQINEIGE